MSYFRRSRRSDSNRLPKKWWLKNVSNIATQQGSPRNTGTEHARETHSESRACSTAPYGETLVGLEPTAVKRGNRTRAHDAAHASSRVHQNMTNSDPRNDESRRSETGGFHRKNPTKTALNERARSLSRALYAFAFRARRERMKIHHRVHDPRPVYARRANRQPKFQTTTRFPVLAPLPLTTALREWLSRQLYGVARLQASSS